MSELLACPCRYCGSKTRAIDHDFRQTLKAVHCDKCGACGPWSGTDEKAIMLHNEPLPREQQLEAALKVARETFDKIASYDDGARHLAREGSEAIDEALEPK